MKQFTPISERHKNQLETSVPYILLFEFEDNSVPKNRYRITNFDQIVYFGTNSSGDQIPYYPCPVYVGDLTENADGDLRQFGITVGVPGPIPVRVAASESGFAGNEVRVILVSSLDLDSGIAMIDERGQIVATSIKEGAIGFEIGGANLFQLIFPQYIYSPDICKWGFGSTECGYNALAPGAGFSKCGITTSGTQVAKPFTLQACQAVGDDEESNGLARLHPGRFGGEPGMLES
jgi:hypothetical protein